MTAVALAAEPAARRRHASRGEYFTWLDTVVNAGIRAGGQARIPVIKSRRYFCDRFLKHRPDLEEWFAAPLLARLDLGPGGTPALPAAGKRNGPCCQAGPYLIHMPMARRMPIDGG